jgi:chloramphenicol 3-O phosphotransferase
LEKFVSGRVIFLNGTSSAGKTTLAPAIQEESPEPYLHLGIDSIFAMVPTKWGGGQGGPLSWDGFRYDRSEHDEDGTPLVSIRYGPVGREILLAAYRSTAVLPQLGQKIIIDEMLLAPELMQVWTESLAGLDVLYVGVYCALSQLEERERARGNPPGLARGHLHTVHAHNVPYDLTVDTTSTAPTKVAKQVLARQ